MNQRERERRKAELGRIIIGSTVDDSGLGWGAAIVIAGLLLIVLIVAMHGGHAPASAIGGPCPR